MNCEEFRELAQAIARDEALDAATLEKAFGHADSCTSCDVLLEESETLTSELRALAAHYAGESAPRRMETQLLAVAGQQRERQAGRARSRIVLAVRRNSLAILGVAAAVVLALALSGWPVVLWHPAWLAGRGQTGQAAGGSNASANAPFGSPAAVSDEDLSTDSFVPLSGTYDLASLDDDPIVRVVLSDDDLESLGLPVGDSGDQEVVADLIIANDGTPQAIRVVSW